MTILLVDVPNIAARNFFAYPCITKDGKPDGMRVEVAASVLSYLENLKERFDTNQIALAFDGGQSKRAEILPCYKYRRAKAPVVYMNKDMHSLRVQMKYLRETVLPQVGYVNIWHEEGYEADDLIGAVCKFTSSPNRAELVIVSSDKDFYQLLKPTVRIYNPASKRGYTHKDFQKEWGISPKQWIDVKALMGCHSDDIPGVRGIGEVYAVRYAKGTLAEDSQAMKNIKRNIDTVERNRKLVTLPYDGTPLKMYYLQDPITMKSYEKVFKLLGTPIPRVIHEKCKGIGF